MRFLLRAVATAIVTVAGALFLLVAALVVVPQLLPDEAIQWLDRQANLALARLQINSDLDSMELSGVRPSNPPPSGQSGPTQPTPAGGQSPPIRAVSASQGKPQPDEGRIHVGDDWALNQEQLVFKGLNALREHHLMPVLSWDNSVAELARARALEVMETQWVGRNHTLRRSGNLENALKVAGIQAARAGETIAYWLPREGAVKSPEFWRDSPAHQGIILSSKYTEVGVGVVWVERSRHIVLDDPAVAGANPEAVVVAIFRKR